MGWRVLDPGIRDMMRSEISVFTYFPQPREGNPTEAHSLPETRHGVMRNSPEFSEEVERQDENPGLTDRSEASLPSRQSGAIQI